MLKVEGSNPRHSETFIYIFFCFAHARTRTRNAHARSSIFDGIDHVVDTCINKGDGWFESQQIHSSFKKKN